MITLLIDIGIQTRILAGLTTQAMAREHRGTDFPWHDLPPDENDKDARNRIIGAREKKAEETSHTFRHLTGLRDRMYYAVRDWRRAIHAARELIPEVAPFVNDPSEVPIKSWTAGLRDELADLGGVIHPDEVGDLPAFRRETVDALRSGMTKIHVRAEWLKKLGPEAAVSVAARPAGGSDQWRTSLISIGRAFETERSRFPDLRHFISIADSEHSEALKGPPWEYQGETRGVVFDSWAHPVHLTHFGFARGAGVVRLEANGAGKLDRLAFQFSGGFFGSGENAEKSRAAVVAFQLLAARVWDCLPDDVRRSLVVEPYLDPSTPGGSFSWLLALYATAWTNEPSCGIKAARCVHSRSPDGTSIVRDLEFLIRRPDKVRPRPLNPHLPPDKAAQIAEQLLRANDDFIAKQLGAETLSIDGSKLDPIKIPPAYFAAFLEPDVFLASKLAIDLLVARAGVSSDIPHGMVGPPTAGSPVPRATATLGLASSQKPDGWTKEELVTQGDISAATFDRIRDAAGLNRPQSGEHGFRYGPTDVRKLITAASNAGGKRTWKTAAARWSQLLEPSDSK